MHFERFQFVPTLAVGFLAPFLCLFTFALKPRSGSAVFFWMSNSRSSAVSFRRLRRHEWHYPGPMLVPAFQRFSNIIDKSTNNLLLSQHG
jgi:hypothetical protein